MAKRKLPRKWRGRPIKSILVTFLLGLGGVVCGAVLVNLMGIGGGARTYGSGLFLASDPCPQWELTAAVQKQVQHDYCVRRFNGKPPRPDIAKTQLNLQDGRAAEFFVFTRSDIVSGSIDKSGGWETDVSNALVDALGEVAEAKGLSPGAVHLLDIGANVGSHTVYVQAAGFPVVAFEPMPLNEDIIRSNLCAADPEQARVTLFTKGLGAEAGRCVQYSHEGINQGDGKVYCNGAKPNHPPHIPYIYQGQVEVVPLDQLLLPCHGGTALPPGMVFGALKMDVEGFEPQVLKGARGFLAEARVPFVVFEIGLLGKEDRRSVLRFFYDLGYQVSSQGFWDGLGQPEDVAGVNEVYLALSLDDERG